MIMKLVDVERDIELDMDLPLPLTGIPKPSSSPPTTPSRERAPLSQEAYGTIATRTADDEETILEVDHMILDHLLHHAIINCLENAHQANTHSVDAALLQVNDFRQLFLARHPNYIFDPELHFRQILLQLILLTTQRFVQHNSTPPSSSLETLRQGNAARARNWIATASRVPTAAYDLIAFDNSLPVSDSILQDNRANFLRTLKLPSSTDDFFYGSPESVSLLDLLPLFMRVSAAACETLFNGNINAQWMRLASEWMLQACLEQYLIYGASGSDALDEAFAWGYKREKDLADGEEVDGSINAMFEDSQFAEEISGWAQLKKKALDELLLHGEEDVRSHLARLSERRPLKEFVESVLGFLRPLSITIAEPVLVQLEKGKLAGMSEADTKEFLRGCGVGEGAFGVNL